MRASSDRGASWRTGAAEPGRHPTVVMCRMGDEDRERRAVDRVVDEVVRRRREVQQVVHRSRCGLDDVVGDPRRPVTERVDGAPVEPPARVSA